MPKIYVMVFIVSRPRFAPQVMERYTLDTLNITVFIIAWLSIVAKMWGHRNMETIKEYNPLTRITRYSDQVVDCMNTIKVSP